MRCELTLRLVTCFEGCNRSKAIRSRFDPSTNLHLHLLHGQSCSICLETNRIADTGILELQTPLHDHDCACSLRHVKMATMTRQQSTLLHEEQAGAFLPRRGSDQNLVCSFHR